jgi:hypothetical protein
VKLYALTCATILIAMPASAEHTELVVDPLPGHAIFHEVEQEAGVTMAISVTPRPGAVVDLQPLCEELRVAAELDLEHAERQSLEVLFIVPRKDMAVEGYYLPAKDMTASNALIRGNAIDRATLDSIVERAGLPTWLLDERDVEHELSCELHQPGWKLVWQDVRHMNGEAAAVVIDRAASRFKSVYQGILDHTVVLAQSGHI